MGNVTLAVAFGIFATATEIALDVLKFPLLDLIVVGLILFATDLLFFVWHPYAILASAVVYLFAVIVGLVGFSWFALMLSGI